MFSVYGFTIDILDDPNAPSQGTNKIVQQLDQIAGLIESGNATNSQISDAVTNISNSINFPTSQQISIQSDAAALADQEVSDIHVYESMVDEAADFLESVIANVETRPWSTDEVMPTDNNWISPFFNHRIFQIIFACVGVCAIAAFLLHGRW